MYLEKYSRCIIFFINLIDRTDELFTKGYEYDSMLRWKTGGIHDNRKDKESKCIGGCLVLK